MFTDVIALDVAAKKYLANFSSNRYLFRIYNAKRPEGHAANDILRNEDATPYAVRCNCGKFHPVVIDEIYIKHNPGSKRTKVLWDPEFEITTSKKTEVFKMIRLVWLNEFF